MRVLVLSTDNTVFTPDSAVARRFRMQAQAVERLDVIVPHGDGALVPLAGNASARGFGLGKAAGFLRTLLAGMRLIRPDLVSVQDPFFVGLLGWLIARMRGSFFHVQLHTDVFDPHFALHSLQNRLKTYLARFILGRADLIRVVSVRVQNSVASRLTSAHVAVLPVFIDAERVEKAVPLNRRHAYPDFEKLILWVGRLESEKNPALALHTLREILEREPRAGLVLVGDGSLRTELFELAESLNISSRVVFEGARDPYPFFKAADVVLVTSQYEGYGMVIVEALLAGCPVVSLDVGVAGEAGALLTDEVHLSSQTLEVLKSGVRGRLAFPLPTAEEYRDLWHAGLVPHAPQSRPAETTPRKKVSVGFIGQGFIGKNYADELERRGITVVRYALEEPYVRNKEAVGYCDVVFIAVPTPTTPQGFDDSIVREAVKLVGEGKTAVIKSTILPGTTKKLQDAFPRVYVLHSPEFLAEATAAYDAAHPSRNIVGIPRETKEHRERAEEVLRLLPPAPFELICSAVESELLKYVNNTLLCVKVVYMNLVYDLAQKLGADFATVRDSVGADPRIGRSHLDPVHKSGHHGARMGRGAGGDCFIKDFETFRRLYQEKAQDEKGSGLLDAVVEKNLHLLLTSGKDEHIVTHVYGKEVKSRILREDSK